ncbi:MAG: hypothetical protein FJ312_02590 [SAR202 cluster bacterium]|nr:hypothetical protein [SAR202 cluster bacterium]
MSLLDLKIEYQWEPFIFEGSHLTFQSLPPRLLETKCSHTGPAVHRWEGNVTNGPYAGKTGVLIGETKNLLDRIRQYKNGTQQFGSSWWRENFLTKGDIYLDDLALRGGRLVIQDKNIPIVPDALMLESFRLVLEKFPILQERLLASDESQIWLVNKEK